MNWHKGQKVKCIKDNWHNPKTSDIRPVKEQELTVRKVVEYEGKIGLLFEEIINEPRFHGSIFGETCFDEKGFAPIETTRTKYVVKEVEVAPKIREMEIINN